MTTDLLRERREACATREAALVEQRDRLDGLLRETVNQLNVVVGRKYELDELIALGDEPTEGAINGADRRD